MEEKIKVKEMFVSTQGEGPFVGYRQLFVRFCGCNLACKYCDTDFLAKDNLLEYTVEELSLEINKFSDIHSVSFTGGEPLLHAKFLKALLPRLTNKVYLETNATLADDLAEILPLVDIISADIKLPSATGIKDTFSKHDKFFEVARQRSDVYLFAKVVFDEKITDNEIEQATQLANKYAIELILQPKTDLSGALPPNEIVERVFSKCLEKTPRVRLIPQVHKFLDIR